MPKNCKGCVRYKLLTMSQDVHEGLQACLQPFFIYVTVSKVALASDLYLTQRVRTLQQADLQNYSPRLVRFLRFLG